MNTRALNISTIVTIIFITVATIISEVWEGFHNFLGAITGHHWVTKGVFSTVLFVALYFILSKSRESENLARDTLITFVVTIICGLAIFLFFVILTVSSSG